MKVDRALNGSRNIANECTAVIKSEYAPNITEIRVTFMNYNALLRSIISDISVYFKGKKYRITRNKSCEYQYYGLK